MFSTHCAQGSQHSYNFFFTSFMRKCNPLFVVCCWRYRKKYLLVYTVWIREVWPRERKTRLIGFSSTRLSKRIYEGRNFNYVLSTMNLLLLLEINLFTSSSLNHTDLTSSVQYNTGKAVSCGFVLLSVSNISKTIMEKHKRCTFSLTAKRFV